MGFSHVPDKTPPQIVVYALADAVAALEAATACGVKITLVSPASAAASAGPAWFRALVEQAREAVQAAAFDSVLDCATEAGHALAALREGLQAVSFSGPEDVRAKIEDIAHQSGSTVVNIDYDAALDLNQCDDAAAACRDWLALKMAEKTA